MIDLHETNVELSEELQNKIDKLMGLLGTVSNFYDGVKTKRGEIMRDRYSDYFLDEEMDDTFMSLNYEHYIETPVHFHEFCLSDNFLGIADDIYEKVMIAGGEIFRRQVLEVVVLAGIGSGKSFLAQICMAYMCHLVLCLRDPHKYFGLAQDKPIEIMNMGLSAGQAKKVVFGGFKNIVSISPWFKNKVVNPNNDILATKIVFRRPILGGGGMGSKVQYYYDVLSVESGNSTESAPIGRNLIMAILDEAAFYLDTDNRDQAEEIYDACKSRIQSRFGGRAGMVIVISSPRYEQDFISRKYNEGLELPDTVFSLCLSTWKAKDRHKMSKEVFLFDTETLRCFTVEEWNELVDDKEDCIGEKEAYSLEFSVEGYSDRYWIIPMDFHDSFSRKPEKALRDLGAKPTDTIEAFFKIRSDIDQAMSYDVDNRVNNMGVRDVSNPSTEEVFVHIDIGMNRSGKGDKAGIAVCSVIGYDPKNDNRPIVKYHFIEQVFAGPTGEVQISDLRAKVFDMRKSGRKIRKVTLDNFQSFDTMQIFNNNGIECGYLSVDTSTEPYEALREGMRQATVIIPSHKSLKKELYELEWVKGGKVDHPPKGSKDVADAVGGSYFSAISTILQGYRTARKASVRIRR